MTPTFRPLDNKRSIAGSSLAQLKQLFTRLSIIATDFLKVLLVKRAQASKFGAYTTWALAMPWSQQLWVVRLVVV
jgi:hypothetical protein